MFPTSTVQLVLSTIASKGLLRCPWRGSAIVHRALASFLT